MSGVGSDGSLGIKAIKEYGGFTLAQAEFDETAMTGMPSSAAATGLVDRVASVESLPAKLLEHQAYLTKVEEQKGTDGARENIRESLTAITAVLRRRLKHDFSRYKTEHPDPADSATDAGAPNRGRPDLCGVSPARTVGRRRTVPRIVYRSDAVFPRRRGVRGAKGELPAVVVRGEGGDDPIRVWVAGCASGEEAYSIAILLQEVIGAHRTEAAVTIFATDIDPQAVAFARTARFRRMDGMSPERLQR